MTPPRTFLIDLLYTICALCKNTLNIILYTIKCPEERRKNHLPFKAVRQRF